MYNSHLLIIAVDDLN